MRTDLRRGFSLLEAIVALLVIGVTSAAALELFAAHARAASRVPALVVASELADDVLTRIRLLRLGREQRLPDSLAAGTFAPPLDAYTWRAEIDHSADPPLQAARVIVRWPSGSYAIESRQRVPTEAPRRGAAR